MASLSTAAFKSPFLLRPSLKSSPPCSFAPLHISVSAPAASPIQPRSVSFSKSRVFAVAEEEQQVAFFSEGEESESEGYATFGETRTGVRPCQLFVCNLPRSCDITQLLELFSPHGTVNSVEVSRDPSTGLSRGFGYVTMNSYLEAREAISALDGSDLSGRQLLVKFRDETESEMKRKKKDLVYESPFKIYIGNLSWSVRPEDLRDHFSKVGTVLSSRLIHDRKDGNHKVYGFVSFASEEERITSLASSGSMFHGREMMIRSVNDDNKWSSRL